MLDSFNFFLNNATSYNTYWSSIMPSSWVSNYNSTTVQANWSAIFNTCCDMIDIFETIINKFKATTNDEVIRSLQLQAAQHAADAAANEKATKDLLLTQTKPQPPSNTNSDQPTIPTPPPHHLTITPNIS